MVSWMCGVFALAACSSRSCGDSARAGERVVVHVVDGRVLEAEIDPRTDDESLWLRFTASGIVLSSSIAWSDVAAAFHEEKLLSPDELRRMAERLETASPDGFPFSAAERRGGGRLGGQKTEAALTAERTGQPAPSGARTVQTLQIDAMLANWDDDVEPDGLEVCVRPVTRDGTMAAVDGVLQLRLLGQRANRSDWKPDFGQLAGRSYRVRSEDFTGGAAVYRLPFAATRPDFDLDVARDGLIHARLNVPGQGVFEASSPLSIRPFSMLRDQLQLHQGKRFLPGEKVRPPRR